MAGNKSLLMRLIEFALKLVILAVGVVAGMFIGGGVPNEIEFLEKGTPFYISYFLLFSITFGLFALAADNIKIGRKVVSAPSR